MVIPLGGRALASVDMALDLISSNAENKRKRRGSGKGRGRETEDRGVEERKSPGELASTHKPQYWRRG